MANNLFIGNTEKKPFIFPNADEHACYSNANLISLITEGQNWDVPITMATKVLRSPTSLNVAHQLSNNPTICRNSDCTVQSKARKFLTSICE